jgi:hypothetical protein
MNSAITAVNILQRQAITEGGSDPVNPDQLNTDLPEDQPLTTDDDEQLLMDE